MLLVNKVLQLDPDTMMRLQTLHGKVIKLVISDWNTTFYLTPTPNGLSLSKKTAQTPDTIITGKLINLCKVGAAGATQQALFNNKIDIAGDTHVGETMRDILQHVDIDWEEHLSRVTGDTVAHQAAYGVKQFLGLAKKTASTLQSTVKEFLFEEARCFPTQQELNRFYQDVDTLRDAVERAEARLNNLDKKGQTP